MEQKAPPMLCLSAPQSVDKQPLVHSTAGSSQCKEKLAGQSLFAMSWLPIQSCLFPPPTKRATRRLLPSWPRTPHIGGRGEENGVPPLPAPCLSS